MPLQVSKPAVAAERAVRSMLARIVATDADYVPALRSAAQKMGWRFFVHHADKVVATINSSMHDKGKHGFSNITTGRFVAGTERAIRRAEQLESVRKGRFEPLLLQVPAIHLVTLWLRNLDTQDDLIMPISPAPKPLRAYHVLSTRDFVAAITELASQAQRAHAEAHRR